MRYAETGSLAFTGSTTSKVLRFPLLLAAINTWPFFLYQEYQQIETTRRVCAVLGALIGTTSCSCPWNDLTKLWDFGIAMHCHYCHSDRQFCVCSKIYIPPFVGSTTRSYNQAWETRWTGGSHRRMASTMMWVYLISSILPSFVVYDNCKIFRSPTQMTALSECLVDFASRFWHAEFSLNPFLLCLRLPEIRAEAVKQLNTLSVLPIILHPEN